MNRFIQTYWFIWDQASDYLYETIIELFTQLISSKTLSFLIIFYEFYLLRLFVQPSMWFS